MNKALKSIKIISVYVLSLLYIIVGVKHFINPDFFIAIVPSYIKWKFEAVIISGFFEIFLGILLLFNKTRSMASWGIILLLIAVFPANIYLYASDTAREILGVSKNQALIRIPFQFTLILISYWHTKESHSRRLSIVCIVLFIFTLIYFLSI